MDFSAAWDSTRAIGEYALTVLPLLLIALVVFALTHLTAVFVSRGVERVSRRWSHNPALPVVLGRFARWGLDLAGLLIALMIALPGFRPAQLASLLGLGSVAIGFAFRDILQNFLAGLLILIQEPYRIGDQIVVGELEGTVEGIETRATFLRTYDNRRVVIPNTVLFTSSVTVNTAYPTRRIEWELTIGYADDVEQAREVILATLAGLPDVLEDPAPDVLCLELAASGVVLRVRWWIRPPQRRDALEARDRVVSRIKAALQAAAIDLPFQTVQLLFHDQTESSDGDRSRQREGWPAGDDPPAPRWRAEERARERAGRRAAHERRGP